jgi:SAM-dependent methyltransferase
MKEMAHRFDDSVAYEHFMGRWSRAAGAVFLDWVAPPVGSHWLDVGCGTGILTELIVGRYSPAAVISIDPSEAQIDHARGQPIARHAIFRVADAQALPFLDSTFDIVASALAINFITDRPQALSEMRRVARPCGIVAGFVWDFEANLSPSWPVRLGMRKVGIEAPQVPGSSDSGLAALRSLFALAGLEDITAMSIDVAVAFPDFDDFWRAQTPSHNPVTKVIAAMTDSDRTKLVGAVRAGLSICPNGRVEYSARANAINARVPH